MCQFPFADHHANYSRCPNSWTDFAAFLAEEDSRWLTDSVGREGEVVKGPTGTGRGREGLTRKEAERVLHAGVDADSEILQARLICE